MADMGLHEHVIKLMDMIYDNQKATIRWNGEHGDEFGIEIWIKQGCILSPHMFNIYTEHVMREAAIDDMGVKIWGRNITNDRYAEDSALLANDLTTMKITL